MRGDTSDFDDDDEWGTEEELWDAKQCAAFVGIIPETWLQWARQGRIPKGKKLGKAIHWPRSVAERIKLEGVPETPKAVTKQELPHGGLTGNCPQCGHRLTVTRRREVVSVEPPAEHVVMAIRLAGELYARGINLARVQLEDLVEFCRERTDPARAGNSTASESNATVK
jgi:hypothetical protein